MDVQIEEATEDQKPVVRRLLELNAHDFSEFDGRSIGPHGEFGYPYLDHYWRSGEARHPFLVTVDGELAGFALVRAGDPNQLAEFFILRKYRRRGVGTAASRIIFERLPGNWSVHEAAGNEAATHFWRRAIPYDFEESADPQGTTQHFTVPG